MRIRREFYFQEFLKNPPTLFLLIMLFSNTNCTETNCRLQQDSNLDHWSRRRACWPLDCHHGPISRIFNKWANPSLSLLILLFSNTNCTEKTCRLQQDSNLDRWSRRLARWPLDYHHVPFSRILKLSLLWLEIDTAKLFVLLNKACKLPSFFTYQFVPWAL